MVRNWYRLVLLGLVLSGVVVITPAFLSAEEKIKLDFRQAEIGEVAGFFARIFQVNMVVDPECRGKITAYTAEEINVSQAWEVFIAILWSLGLGVEVYDSAVLVQPRGR